jgi:hypothetical protein
LKFTLELSGGNFAAAATVLALLNPTITILDGTPHIVGVAIMSCAW